ncbi:uncharacterized protein F4812DRAFT_421577 [Daldinia caldariorum]|uniref:uncharacterized protein n=1 Tax=Daldinia caldariorum TaxID=326644 RepID=UPI002007DD24|nr:uncharacterized protein F4812DRAFT_421577 [Daldinia caldariorum]KAI1470119.1 hypothetical protein F4812DRAFT_421577 [Daldinia caldariorum]
MADLQQPSPTKRKLPFKRTARRKSAEAGDNDGLSLFSRSGVFFEEQQRLAKEKAEKEKAQKAAREAKEEQERRERLARQREAEKDTPNRKHTREPESPKKRRRVSRPSEEKVKNSDDEDIFDYKSTKKQKSPSVPFTPDYRREDSLVTSNRGSEGLRKHGTRSQSVNVGAPVISLDDDDDDDPAFIQSPTKHAVHSHKDADQGLVSLEDDGDFPAEDTKEERKDEEEDPSEYYVRLAMERAQKAKEEQEARRRAGSNSLEDENDPAVQILIHSQLDGVYTLMFRRKLSQKLTIVYQTWIEQQVAKHSVVPRSVLETMFFTWKGNKVYPHTTLQTLGIKPERDGTLYPSWKGDQEGYQGRDKVYFEAWTQGLYEEFLEEKDKQRLRDLGELIDDEPEEKAEVEQPQNSQGEQKVRVLFKPKDQQPTKATVRPSTTAAQLIKLYRRLANIPENKTIELRWDGEVLDAETTVEEAEIEDMDSLEVHIK